ncbi:nucleotidyl transferase [Catovirus CTV1]|uniref:Nucleotidyl transferase n=1 Tax=Catovirus CTV1 TaxID=1977631 RepID=A0A1V0SAL4_9VIRU|nr:nucleotidyl transferase [Catovirus CTV1]
MNIIIPLGGLGERFKLDGYTKPKPLINIFGKEMIFYLIDNLNVQENDKIFVIYHKDLDKFNFKDIIHNRYKNIKLIRLDKNTEGATETILFGLNNIDDKYLSNKTMLLDCDTFYFTDIVSKYRNQNNNAVFCFKDMQEKPIFSYVSFDENNIINSIKEKNKISHYANTGCYCFNQAYVLKNYCQKVISNDIRENHEYYTSCVISEMLKDNHIFYANLIDINDFKCVGTPLQLKIFCDNFKNYDKLRICFDLDNTLVTYPTIKNDYSSVQPLFKNIEYLRYLKKLGHTIIIYTARRMKTHQGNIGKIIQDVGKITLETLEKFNIPYDELYFGKPYANYYIDDLGVNSYSEIEKEIGIYQTKIAERDFNEIIPGTLDIITKKSNLDKIKGEIYYYQNIPLTVKQYFPLFIGHGTDWYSMEKINGITLSYLYVNESLTVELFTKFLNIVKDIHSSAKYTKNISLNIYDNYKNKLINRYTVNDYSIYKNSDKIYDKLINYFTEYENNDMGCGGVIHGDPVLTNCILDINNHFKFIDMRGQLGNILTIFGDIYYDYGKIYQSISGYDEILLNKIVSQSYKKSIIKVFENFVVSNFGEQILYKIKMIKNAHLFTLLPLHKNDKCSHYYELIDISI